MPASPATSESKRVDPPFDAEWQIDPDQEPARVLEHHQRTAASPAAHDAFRRLTLEKAERFGVIHVDPATGYRARFHPREAPAAGTGRRGRPGNAE